MVTKQAIFEAANRLMLKKSFDRITVKDIAEECQITRQTFYYHFQDILEMLEWGLDQEMEKMFVSGKNAETMEEALMCCLERVMEKKIFFFKLANSRYNQHFGLLLKEKVKQYMQRMVQCRTEPDERPLKDILFWIDYHAGAISSMIIDLLLRKEPVNLEYEVSQIVRIINGQLH